MADAYLSPQARRRAALSQALLSGAMTAPQGGMVGRYYVGEGIGSGMTRIGQALLADRMGHSADAAESEYRAGEQAKRQEAMTALVDSITKPREEVLENYTGDLSGLSRTQMRQPTSQEIGAALLKYQGDTGQEIDKNMLSLLAPTAAGARDDALGVLLRKGNNVFQTTKRGDLINLGEGFDAPTRVLDLGGELVITPTSGAPKPIAKFGKGLKPEDTPQAAADKAGAQAAAEAEARAKADRDAAKTDAVKSAVEVGQILDQVDSLLGKGTGSTVGTVIAGIRKKTNNANAQDVADQQLQVLSANLLGEFARSKILGPNPSEGDRKVYEQMAGQIGDTTLDQKVRRAAVKAIRDMAQTRAGNAPKQSTGPAAGQIVDGYRFKGGNPNDQNNWEPAK